MKKYPKYKDSGVAWIGEVPEHWEKNRFKDILKIKDEKVGDRKDLILLSLTTNGVIVRDLSEGKGKFSKDVKSYKIIHPKDLILCLFDVDETPRTVGVSRNEGMITGAYDVFGVVNANTEYIYYMYLSFDDAKSLKPLYRGLRKTIPLTSLRSSYLFLPSPKEQDKIVSFIKKKSTQIDLSISETEKEIENLNELKQTEIAHLVTHGLNPNVPMKDSGIPWIGQIPEHWDVKRLAMVAFEHKMSNKDIHHQNLLSLSYGNVIRKDINKTEGLLPSSFDGYQIVEKGNIILRLTDLQNDHKSLRVGMVEEKGIITSAYLCLGVRDNINPLYLYYLLHSYDILKVFYSMGSGLRQSLNYEQMKKMGIVVPPANEQSFIIVAIKAITSKIDRMVNGLNNQITYLKELKQRIISDAVTGKIDVREGSIS